MAFQYGKAIFPLDAGTNTSLLPVCDPALAKILDYLRFAIRKYAETAILSAIRTTKPIDRDEYVLSSAVMQVVPVDPSTIAGIEQLQFPLWCGWPKSTKYGSRTLNWVQDVRTIGLAYVLRPFVAHQAILWTPLLNSISQICNAALTTGHDPDYNGDERVLLQNKITSAKLISADFGHYDFAGKATPPFFPAWVAELELTEQVQPYSAGVASFDGADVTVTQQAYDDVLTRIASNAAQGATSIQVVSTEGFRDLDVIVLARGTAREEAISIVTVDDATHFTLDASGLAFAHAAADADAVERKPITIVQAKTDVG